MAINKTDTTRVSTGTRVATGGNVFAMVAVAIAITIFVNYLFGPERFRAHFDWTSSGDNTLSQKSISILAALPEKLGKDVQGRDRAIEFISIFGQPRSEVELRGMQMVNDAVQIYKSNGHSRIAYSQFDGITDITALIQKLQELKIKEPTAGLIVALGDRVRTITLEEMIKIRRPRGGMYGGDNIEQIEENRIEEAITSNLLALLETDKPKAYFITGHGEPSIDEVNDDDVSRFADALRQAGYDAESLDLTEKGSVPADARVIIWFPPSKPMLPKELAALKQYAHKGGRFIVALDPVPDPNIDADILAFLAEWAILSKHGVVCGYLPDPLTGGIVHGIKECVGPDAVRVRYTDFSSAHPITRNFFEQGITLPFPAARSFERIIEGNSKATVEDLGRTGKSTWLDLDPINFSPDKDTETVGGQPVLVAATLPNDDAPETASAPVEPDSKNSKEGRLIALGSSTLGRNRFFDYGRDLLLSSVEWLAGREFAAGIGPKKMKSNVLVDNSILLPRVGGAGFILAGLAIFAAGYVWNVRRGIFSGFVVALAVGAVPFLLGLYQFLF
ncbi:MAG: Gldg family protein [Planctomycetota bacterium]